MRKFLIAAALLVTVAFSTQAKAQVPDNGLPEGASGCQPCRAAAPIIIGSMWLYGVIVGPVVQDIMAGGLNRKYAEVVPGAGFASRDYANAAKLTHEFNVAMGYSDDADTTKYLASASR